MLSSIDRYNLLRHEQMAAQLIRQWLRWYRHEQFQLQQQTESVLLVHIVLLTEFAEALYAQEFPDNCYARMVAYWAVANTENDVIKQKMKQSLAADLSQHASLNETRFAEFNALSARIHKEEVADAT